jgi:pre-mRNA-processing factor SLU7
VLISSQAKFAGENFLRYSGDAPEVQKLQLFAWGSSQRGSDVHLQANPTAGELLHAEYKQKKETLKDKNKVSILSKYGGAEYLETAPAELRQGQTEEYVEYSRTGQVVKGHERAKARSKYAEDVFINNHSAVWGSWYDPGAGAWGYACCHSTVHASYCAGQAGIEAARASSAQHLLAGGASEEEERPAKALVEEQAAGAGSTRDAEDRRRRAEAAFSSKKRLGEGEVELDRERLSKAISEEKKRKGKEVDGGEEREGKRKRDNYEVTEEDLEAYRMNRRMTDDPMANYVDNDDY